MRTIDLDTNATNPLLPPAFEAMRPWLLEPVGNPSSPHRLGRKARQALEDARENVARMLGAEPDEVLFTSGATEANNLALFALAESTPGRVLASPLEHPCVVEPLKILARRGFAVDWLPVTPSGVVDLDSVTTHCHSETRLVVVMHANHETGALQPIRELRAKLPAGVAFHTDAAQSVGKIPVHFHELDVTTLCASGHKFGGPVGLGILLVRKGTPFAPRMFGGHQQGGRRPGTEPVALVVGLAAALEHAVSRLAHTRSHLERLQRTLWARLCEKAAPVVRNGPEVGSPQALPSTLNVSFPGCRADVLLMSLDLAGVACSTGSACSSGSLLPSPVLTAMGVPDDVLRSAMRFSFGPTLTMEEMEDAAERIVSCVKRVRS